MNANKETEEKKIIHLQINMMNITFPTKMKTVFFGGRGVYFLLAQKQDTSFPK